MLIICLKNDQTRAYAYKKINKNKKKHVCLKAKAQVSEIEK